MDGWISNFNLWPTGYFLCYFCRLLMFSPQNLQELYLRVLTGDRHHKQFYFLDADCLVVGESQCSSWRLARKCPVKPPQPTGTILIIVSLIDIIASDASENRTCMVEVSG